MRNAMQQAMVDAGFSLPNRAERRKAKVTKPIAKKSTAPVAKLHRMGDMQEKYQGCRTQNYDALGQGSRQGMCWLTGNIYAYNEGDGYHYLIAADQRIHSRTRGKNGWGTWHPYEDNRIHGREVVRLARNSIRIRLMDGNDWEIV